MINGEVDGKIAPVTRRSWIYRHKFLTAVIVLVVLWTLYGISQSLPSSTTPETQNAHLSVPQQVKPNWTAFNKETIQAAVQNLDNNGGQYSDDFPKLVEIQGKILQKKTYIYTGAKPFTVNYIKISDKNGYVAIVMLDPTKLDMPELYSQFSVGDEVIARGALGSNQCGGNQNADEECSVLDITQAYVPIIIALEPAPEFGNKAALEK